ncbi:PQQ-binding-like beta-propeller repeat protein [Natrononativus amylolyticus]|uniref:PQQ-binding-like beta-propeller repeat protein n=1 Tax=Natrononativus amylolyticus TaxID=2963434 RepID=UPI0020CD226D|nr:PQQ-binding-like beta-propeller repeat protein [Natrononativus amylolyticus]
MLSRRHLLAGAGVSLVGTLGGRVLADRSSSSPFDWPMTRYDPAGTGYNPDASGPKDGVEVAWLRDTESPMHGLTAPILVGETLYGVGRQDLVAFDRDTGEIRFTREGQYWSSPARADATAYRSDTLAVSSYEGVYGLSAGGGYELLGRSVGTERWHAPGEDTGNWSGSPAREPSPVAADGTVYATVPDTDRVVAIDASSGRVRWERTVGSALSSGVHRPAVRDGTVYASAYSGDVAAIDAETGERRWSVAPELVEGDHRRYREFHPPTATAEGLVVPHRIGVSLLEPTDGSVRWEYTHGGNATDGSAAVADGTVFVTDGDGSLHAIDLESGDRAWTADYGPDTDPVVADGVVYLGYQYGELAAIDAETGERRFTYEGSIYFSQPIVGDGVLYVLDGEGLLALEEAS